MSSTPPTYPIRLDRAITKGVLVHHKVGASKYIIPPKGHVWMLLSARVLHTTGTKSVVTISTNPQDGTRETFWETEIPAASGSDNYALFNNRADDNQSQFQIILVTREDVVLVSCHANSYVIFRFLEWQAFP